MYLFYEHHRKDGAVAVTDCLVSSYKSGKGIDWKREKDKMEMLTKLLKMPPIGVRSFDPDTKVWSYNGGSGEALLSTVEATFKAANILNFEFVEVEDLIEKIKNDQPLEQMKPKFNAQDFFYNNAPASKTLTREQVIEKLVVLLGTEVPAFTVLVKADESAAKRLYRRAALNFHPDRNGGDASKMSELNMLWRMYNGS